MKLRSVLLVLTLFVCAHTLRADDFWDKKPSAEWSDKDAKKIMEDSPWANKWTKTELVIQQTSRSADAADRDTSKEMWYRAQFWSALPMREARVRGMAYQMKYNQMKPEEKKAFDERAKQYIEAPQDQVVVRVTYGSNVDDFARKMTRYWTEQTMEMQKAQIFLVADGKRIPMVAMQQGQPGANEFYVIFPRTQDGQPLLTKPDSKLGIEFQHPDVAGPNSAASQQTPNIRTAAPSNAGQTTAQQITSDRNGERVFIQFKPSKMMYHGALAF
jgi:hypothetical protein